MRLGLLTDCFLRWPLERVVGWAAANGYTDLEVAAWPAGVEDHATHIDVETFDEVAAGRLTEAVRMAGVGIAAVSCYDNLLDPDRGDGVRGHLLRCCDAARLLGVGTVGMFVGRDPGRTVRDDLAAASELLPDLVDEARRRDVTLVVENCHMPVWHPDGQPGNLAYSPELWGWLAGMGIGLNYDPSHLPPLGIDPVAALRTHGAPTLFQAKGVEVFPEVRDRTGFPGPVLPSGAPWWRPGIVAALQDIGYDGPVIVEQEDPVLGSAEGAVVRGLSAARSRLVPLLG